MVEIVVGPVVDRDTLRRQPVPRADVEREQRRDRRALVMAEVVLSHLAVVVRETVGKRRRLREQQQPRVLVTETGEEHDLGRLEELLAVREIGDAARAALRIDVDGRDRGAGDGLELVGRLCARNRRDRRRVLGVDVAAAGVAETVIHAARSILVAARIDRRRPGKRMPAQRLGGRRHFLVEGRPAKRRHRVLALARSLERIAARIDLAVDVPGLP